MTVPRDRVLRLAASAGWILVVLPLATVLLSIVLSPATNWTVRTALAGFCVLAIVRPDAALLVTIALGGFGIILAHYGGVPSLRVTEVLIVGSLAGCFVRAVPHGSAIRHALTRSITAPVLLFALATVASGIVWQRVYQFQTGYPSAYFQALFEFLSRDYFVQPGEFLGLVSHALILEGLGLYVVVGALCRADETFFERALRMLALGGAGVAALSAVRLAEILLRNPDAIAMLRTTSAGLRISPQIPDYIAAGSYFGLAWVVALGLAMASRARMRLVWLAIGVPLLGALYLTGSRSVIAAALAGLLVLLLMAVRRTGVAARAVAVTALVAVAIMIITYSWFTGRDVAGEMAKDSLIVRVELIRAGLRVIETRPIFGVGIERFYLLAPGLASPELHRLWQARMTPHNDFIRFGAELGLVGLGLFLWMLGSAAGRTMKAVRRTRDVPLAGLAGGLAAFLVTSLVSNPLMVREVSYLFWIALGLAAGYSARLLATPEAAVAGMPEFPRRSRHSSRLRWALAVLLAGSIVVSIPFRARMELSAIDVTRVSYGFYDWGTDEDGTRWRWSGPAATFFVDGRARMIEIPLSGAAPSGAPQEVEVRVDGRLANRLPVGPERQRLRVPLPGKPSTEARRIDLAVSPTWIPADVMPGNEDRRELGVKVGEITVITNP